MLNRLGLTVTKVVAKIEDMEAVVAHAEICAASGERREHSRAALEGLRSRRHLKPPCACA